MARMKGPGFQATFEGKRKRSPQGAAADYGMTPSEIKRHNERMRRMGRSSKIIRPKMMKGRGEF